MTNGIYSLIPQEQLEKVLRSLQAFTELSVQLIDADGTLLLSYGKDASYCRFLKEHVFRDGECAALHRNAGLRAQEIGEAYIFACHAQLNHIAFPLIYRGELMGSVILGPFLMDAPDSTLISGLAEKHRLSPGLSLELYDRSASLQIISPSRVNHLKTLIDHLLTPLIPGERALLMQTREKATQQAHINETIQFYKEQNPTSSLLFFYHKEKELLGKVRTGNTRVVKALLNELIGYVLFSEGGSKESVRIRAMELTTLLSRVAMDGGANTDRIHELNENFLTLIYREQNLDELCLLLQNVAVSFMDAMFYEKDKGNPYIRKALRYIADNYQEHLELAAVAEHVQLSPGYLSTLFRQVVGTSFREHLCKIRVEESKRLLLSAEYSLAQIALAVGFPDQSYYCKMFKRIVGLTPGKYRTQPHPADPKKASASKKSTKN